MSEYLAKIVCSSISRLDRLLSDAMESRSGMSAYYILTEDGRSLSHLHTDEHLAPEREQADRLSMHEPAYMKSRTVALGTVTESITDGDTTVPAGSTVIIVRATEPCHYIAVAEVAINGEGVANGWRCEVPRACVSVHRSALLSEVAQTYGDLMAEIVEDEA